MQAVRWATARGLWWGVSYLEQCCEVDRTIKDAYYDSPSGTCPFYVFQPQPSHLNWILRTALVPDDGSDSTDSTSRPEV